MFFLRMEALALRIGTTSKPSEKNARDTIYYITSKYNGSLNLQH